MRYDSKEPVMVRISLTKEAVNGIMGWRMKKTEGEDELSDLTFFDAKAANQYLADNGIDADVNRLKFDSSRIA